MSSFYTIRVTPKGCESPLNDSLNLTFTDKAEADRFADDAIIAGHRVREWNGKLFGTAKEAMAELEFWTRK